MKDLLSTLNPQQQEAVCHTDGPLFILAGAGSGKTRVLTHRIAWLIDQAGVNPWNILAITFTNKAAEEMRNRVDSLVGYGAEHIWVSTFHSTCARILRRHIDQLGYDAGFSIYDTDDSRQVMHQVIKNLDLDPKVYKERQLLTEVSAAKNKGWTPSDLERESGTSLYERNCALAYAEYQSLLKKNNAADFDDLLCLTVQLFELFPEVLAQWQERFRYILVDEYQDTNGVQFKLLKLLAGKYQNLCVVGDDDQSIYRFRGADITNILSFEETFPDTKVIRLEQNYRSMNHILRAANAVIANNARRKGKSLWSERPDGQKVRFKQFDTGTDEAEAVVDEIAREVREGRAQYRDYAILYRTNAQSRGFEEACVHGNVPYRMIGGVNFYQRAEIKDILAYLKTIDNARDDLAVRRIVNVPKRGIGQTSLDKAQMFADEHGMSLYQALAQADGIPELKRAAAKMHGFVRVIEELRSLSEGLGPSELITELLEKVDYFSHFDDEERERIQARQENIEEMINKAAEFEAAHEMDEEGPLLSLFLREVALVADIDSLDENEDRILLMTLHGAKGLEFPYVYMTGMEDGLFPGYLSINSGDPMDMEEERRLCYVGITRAMDRLTMTCARQRMVRGQTSFNPISRFVSEIPDEELDSNVSRRRRVPYGTGMEPSFGRAFGAPTPHRSLDDPNLFETEPARGAGFSSDGFGRLGSAAVPPARKPAPKPSLSDFKVERLTFLPYEVGDRVEHVKFGEGVVTAIENGKKDYEVTVIFDKAGQKRMFASFAKLKKKE